MGNEEEIVLNVILYIKHVPAFRAQGAVHRYLVSE